LSAQHRHSRRFKPSKFTITVACSSVLTAGAAAGALVLQETPAGAQQIGSVSAAGNRAAASRSRLGPALADFQAQHAQAQVASARAAARARVLAAARARAAKLAASTPAVSRPAATVAASGSPQAIAQAMLGSYGWSASQFSCLNDLWSRESGWSTTADNPSSGAYGIPQAMPGSKMASAGPDWETDAATQIKWGLGYIKGSYGSPCDAWAHEESAGWY
jgi:hypothetical protein